MLNSNFLQKYDAWIGALAFLFVVFFTHAPFFLFIPVPGISMDTFNYFWFAKEIFDGQLPVVNQPHDFPWGYPFFLYALKALGGNILNIVLAQTFIYALAGLWLIRQFSKVVPLGGCIAALGLILYTFQPYTIRHNLTLYMESLFTSTLFLLFGSVAMFFRAKQTIAYFMIIFSAFILMLIRPNGILMLAIPILILLVEAVRRNREVGYYIFIILGFLTLNASFNYHFKGKFEIGDSDRIKKVVGRFAERFGIYKRDVSGKIIVSPMQNPKEMIKAYVSNIYTSKPSFYFSLQRMNYEYVVKKEMAKDTALKMFDGRAYVDAYAPGLRLFVFDGYNPDNYSAEIFSERLKYDSVKQKSYWLKAVHFAYELLNKSKVLLLLYLVFFLTFGYHVYKWFKQLGNSNEIIIGCGLIHLINLISLPFIHNQFQARYIHVTEFVVILIAIAGLQELVTLYFRQTKQKVAA